MPVHSQCRGCRMKLSPLGSQLTSSNSFANSSLATYKTKRLPVTQISQIPQKIFHISSGPAISVTFLQLWANSHTSKVSQGGIQFRNLEAKLCVRGKEKKAFWLLQATAALIRNTVLEQNSIGSILKAMQMALPAPERMWWHGETAKLSNTRNILPKVISPDTPRIAHKIYPKISLKHIF